MITTHSSSSKPIDQKEDKKEELKSVSNYVDVDLNTADLSTINVDTRFTGVVVVRGIRERVMAHIGDLSQKYPNAKFSILSCAMDGSKLQNLFGSRLLYWSGQVLNSFYDRNAEEIFVRTPSSEVFFRYFTDPSVKMSDKLRVVDMMSLAYHGESQDTAEKFQERIQDFRKDVSKAKKIKNDGFFKYLSSRLNSLHKTMGDTSIRAFKQIGELMINHHDKNPVTVISMADFMNEWVHKHSSLIELNIIRRMAGRRKPYNDNLMKK